MKRSIWSAAAILPAIAVVITIFMYGVDVPYMDEWDTPGDALVRLETGSLSFDHLFAQHTESRMLVPRIVYMAMAAGFGWHPKHMMFFSWLLAGMISCALYFISRYTLAANQEKRVILLFVANLFVFNLIQYEYWLWGFLFAAFIPILSMAVSLAVLYAPTGMRSRFCTVMFMATVATFSFANGILCWIILLPVLLHKTWPERQKRYWQPLLWTALFVFGISMVVYFRGYHRPPNHPGLTDALTHPFQSIIYFFSFMGLPVMFAGKIMSAPLAGFLPSDAGSIIRVVFGKMLCPLAGILITGLFFWAIFKVFKAYRQGRNISVYLPWLALGCYAFASGVLTTLGRVGFGLEQVYSPRYVAYPTYAYVSLVYLYALMIDAGEVSSIVHVRDMKIKPARIIGGALVLMLIGVNLVGAVAIVTQHYPSRLFSKACLSLIHFNGIDKNIVAALHPVPKRLRRVYNVLSKGTMFRFELAQSSEMFTIDLPFSGKSAYGEIASVHFSEENQMILMGTAVLPEKGRAADAVLFTYENQPGHEEVFLFIQPNLWPWQVGNKRRFAFPVRSGWKATLSRDELPGGFQQIHAWAFDAEMLKAYRIIDKGADFKNRDH